MKWYGKCIEKDNCTGDDDRGRLLCLTKRRIRLVVRDDVLKDLSIGMLKSVDTLLFGRVTYDMMAAYFPTASDEDPVIQKAMNGLPKIVFSRSLEKADWNNTLLVRGLSSKRS